MDSELQAAIDRASIGQHEHGYAVVSGGTQEQLQSIVDAARKVANLQTIVDEQAEDVGLWYGVHTAPEAYLQQELRRLHAAIEEAPDGQ